jgi:hypothetical protein
MIPEFERRRAIGGACELNHEQAVEIPTDCWNPIFRDTVRAAWRIQDSITSDHCCFFQSLSQICSTRICIRLSIRHPMIFGQKVI